MHTGVPALRHRVYFTNAKRHFNETAQYDFGRIDD
jgi:hypothetical protein